MLGNFLLASFHSGMFAIFLDFRLSECAVVTRMPECNFSILASEPSPPTRVNFVLKPKPFYVDPLKSVFEDPAIERNLHRMFSREAVEITENTLSSYDYQKIQEFKNSISFQDGFHYINIPWDEKKVNLVPSNHAISLKVLDRVRDFLTKRRILNLYTEAFLEQEREGFIERFNVPPEQYANYIWIPHRPVIKDDDLTTTKIKPVFNCSLKVWNAPSLMFIGALTF